MVEHGASNAKIMGSILRESKSWSKCKTVTWMQCKSLWIKASAKCINVNVKACFNLTDWSVFEAAATDLDELTETVTSYISFCEDMCIPTRTHLTYNNDKPWFTVKLRQLRQAKEDAYRKGDKGRIPNGFFAPLKGTSGRGRHL